MDDPTLPNFRRELDALAALRDQLRLVAQLATADLKGELKQLEQRWQLAEAQYQELRAHTASDLDALRADLTVLLSDLKRGFEGARRTLQRR